MKITVLNGSPKGEISVTMQYLQYMRNHFPNHEFKVFNIGQDIKKIEKKPELFQDIIDEVRGSDGVLWLFPVYIILVPSQLKRFIELIFERKAEKAFKDRYGTTLTTSIHFVDNTAHNYVHAVSEDLGMRYVTGYSADMNDLMKEEERRNLLRFTELFFRFIEEERPTPVQFSRVSYDMPEYEPGEVEDVPRTKKRNIVLITDAKEGDVNLNRMIDVFVKFVPSEVDVLNINDIDIRGGCMGCLRCGYDGICFYKDEMMDAYNNRVLPADAVVYAGSIKDRYLSARWKMFFDRSFFEGHRPVLMGKQAGFIISGPLRQIPNLRLVFEIYTQVQMMNTVGFVTDEYEDSAYLTSLLEDLAEQLAWSIEEGFKRPLDFLGVGTHLLFRDFVYNAKVPFRADYEFYKEHDLFDFPQKKMGLRALNIFVPPVMRIPPVRAKFEKEMKRGMILPYKRYLKK